MRTNGGRTATLDDICPYVRFAGILSLGENIADLIRNDVKTRDCRLFYIIRGCGTIEIEGISHTLASGSLCIIQPGTLYKWCPDAGCESEIICVNFDYTQQYSNYVNSYHPETADSFDETHSHGRIEFDDAPCLNAPLWLDNMHEAESPLRSLVYEKLLSLTCSAQIMRSLLAQVICTAVRTAEMSDRDDRSHDIILVRNVLAYIQSNYAKDLTNEHIAAHFRFHPNYLSRLIKKSTGQSLHRYVVMCRINAAKELLTNSGMKVNEIAQAVGFCDIPHFTRAFRQHTGMLPSDYAALTDSERAAISKLLIPDAALTDYEIDQCGGCGNGY